MVTCHCLNVRSFLRNFFLSRRVEADLDNEVRLHLELMFGRALAQPGVTYIPAHGPQAKGRIERLWGTFQDRLTSELRLAAPPICLAPARPAPFPA